MELATRQNNITAVPKTTNSFFQKPGTPFFSPVLIQPKLAVGPADDVYEREADSVAERVMRMPGQSSAGTFFPVAQPISKIQRHCATCEAEEKLQRMEVEKEELIQSKPGRQFNVQRKCAACEQEDKMVQPKRFVQRKCDKCDEEEHAIQPKSDGYARPNQVWRKCATCENDDHVIQPKSTNSVLRKTDDALVQRKCTECEEEEDMISRKESAVAPSPQVTPSVHHVLNSPGHPLDKYTRAFMESRFGYDFADVRIHNDVFAHQSSKDIHALAYTHGEHVVFGAGQYQPGTTEGKKLLAHELTHVVQQKGKLNNKIPGIVRHPVKVKAVQRVTAEEQDILDNPHCKQPAVEKTDEESEKLKKTPFWDLNYSDSIPPDLTQIPAEDKAPLFRDLGACSFCPVGDTSDKTEPDADKADVNKKVELIRTLPPVPKLPLPAMHKVKRPATTRHAEIPEIKKKKDLLSEEFDLLPIARAIQAKYNYSHPNSTLKNQAVKANSGLIPGIGSAIHDLVITGSKLQLFILGNSLNEKAQVRNFIGHEKQATADVYHDFIADTSLQRRSLKSYVQRSYDNFALKGYNELTATRDSFKAMASGESDALFKNWGDDKDELFKEYDFASSHMRSIHENGANKASGRGSLWSNVYRFAIGYSKEIHDKVHGLAFDRFFTGKLYTQRKFINMSEMAGKVSTDYASGMRDKAGESADSVDCRKWNQLEAINAAYRQVSDGLSLQRDNGEILISNSATLNDHSARTVKEQTLQVIDYTWKTVNHQLKAQRDAQVAALTMAEQEMIANIDENALQLNLSIYKGITEAADFLVTNLDNIANEANTFPEGSEESALIRKTFFEVIDSGKSGLNDIQLSFMKGFDQNATAFTTGIINRNAMNNAAAYSLTGKFGEFAHQTREESGSKFYQIFRHTKSELAQIVNLYRKPMHDLPILISKKIKISLVNIKSALCEKLNVTHEEMQKTFRPKQMFDKVIVHASQKAADNTSKAYQRSARYIKWIIVGLIVGISIVLTAGALAPAAVGLIGLGKVVVTLAVIGAVTNALIRFTDNVFEGKPPFQGVFKDAVIGGITGLVGATGGFLLSKAGPVISYLGNLALDVGTNIVVDLVAGNEITLLGVLGAAALGIGIGSAFNKALTRPGFIKRLPQFGRRKPPVPKSADAETGHTKITTDVEPTPVSPQVSKEHGGTTTMKPGESDLPATGTKPKLAGEAPDEPIVPSNTITKDKTLAKADTDDGHEAVVTRQGVGKCSPDPCPVLYVAYADQIREFPEMGIWERKIHGLRLTDPKRAAEEAARFIRTAEAGRRNAQQRAMYGLDDDDINFRLHVSEKKAKQLETGEKNLVDREITFDIDEVLPVGDGWLSRRKAYKRAVSAYNRHLLDPNTNRRSKWLGIDVRESSRVPGVYHPQVSVTRDPNVLITKRFSEVAELDELFARAVKSVPNEGRGMKPTKVKAAINREMRRLIAEDASDAARNVREALRKLNFEYIPGKGYTMVKKTTP